MFTWFASSSAPETTVERLHRMGVQCQDVFERDDCAIDNFERMLGEATNQRELVTDAMLRLVDIYQSSGNIDAANTMLRRFWVAGIQRPRRGHIPYSTRFLPDELDMLFMVHVAGIVQAPITRSLDADTRELAVTCDPDRRQLLEDRRQWKRARHKAKETGQSAVDLRYEEHDRRLDYEARAQKRERTDRFAAPVFVEALCPLVRAFGPGDLRSWVRMVGAMKHSDFRVSVGIAEIPQLAAKLRAAQAAGTLVPRGNGRWSLPDVRYSDGEIQVASVDKNELIVAPQALMSAILRNAARRGRSMNRQVDQLLSEIPNDADAFFVMTEEAMVELGLGSMARGRQALFKAFLPRPKGFQLAAVFHDYFGVFLRMPTDNPIKGSVMVNLVRNALEAEQDDASAAEVQLLQQLDISQTEDKRALLLSYVLSPAQLHALIE